MTSQRITGGQQPHPFVYANMHKRRSGTGVIFLQHSKNKVTSDMTFKYNHLYWRKAHSAHGQLKVLTVTRNLFMREHSRDCGRLQDILKYAQNVEQIVKGVSYEQFIDDIRIYYSVMKNIEVIGEAANMLTRHFRETHAELPWRLIVSMRNVLWVVHLQRQKRSATT